MAPGYWLSSRRGVYGRDVDFLPGQVNKFKISGTDPFRPLSFLSGTDPFHFFYLAGSTSLNKRPLSLDRLAEKIFGLLVRAQQRLDFAPQLLVASAGVLKKCPLLCRIGDLRRFVKHLAKVGRFSIHGFAASS